MLARISERDIAVAIRAGRTLVAALPGDPAHVATVDLWHSEPGVHPAFVANLFTAIGRIDATLAVVATDHVLDWPATYGFDTVLLPAMRILLETPETAGQRAVQALRDACIAHLDARIALPLEPPSDWRRDNKLGCNCKDCRALGTYLSDATQKVWVFAAAEARRRHVESSVRHAHCDVDMATEKRGSPHRLICTKNQASYERRCEQRTNDVATREWLVA